MRIAITGSSGRVGRAIMEMALAQGHSVVSIDRVSPASEAAYPDARFIQADITDYAEFEQAMRGCEALVHMAPTPTPGYHPDPVVHNNNGIGMIPRRGDGGH